MPVIDVYGMRGNVVIDRDERAEGQDSLVFIHGAGGSVSSWQAQLDYFNRSFNCLVMELPGHGAAQGPGAQEIKSYALWIRGALDELGVASPFIIGHSMGGAITMDLALRFPALPKGLVLAGTGARLRVDPGILEGIKSDFSQTVERICGFSFAKDVPKEMLEVATAEMMKNSPDVLFGDFLACDRFDAMQEIEAITVPTLVICGDQDTLTPIKYARYLADRIAGSRLDIIEGAGHEVMVECPEQFNKKAETFLRSVEGADA
ncbi:MAG: alpha/beta hydrolase [Deltaproteobacteria bacterium]|nr:alpha/beta hydrolase [Deltaproteobacteria bacterium]